MTANTKVFYIGGYSRCGSTVLDQLLGSLKNIFSTGELYHVWGRGVLENQLCGCGKPFCDCEFWTEVLTDGFGKIGINEAKRFNSLIKNTARLRYLINEESYYRNKGKEILEITEMYSTLYKSISKISGASVIVDSSKHPAFPYLLSKDNSIDLFLGHLIRDSRAVAFSCNKKKLRPEIYWEKALMPRSSFFQTSMKWAAFNLALEKCSDKVSKSVKIKYEEFCDCPEETINGILAYFGVEVDCSFDKSIDQNIQHSISGNPIRFKKGPISIRKDDEWEDKMNWFSKKMVTVLTYPLLKKYGYL